MKKNKQKRTDTRWRRFSHKPFAVFRSVHCELSIGVLGVAMLSSCTSMKTLDTDQLHTGDLIFCIEPDGSEGLGGAIAAVTEGVAGERITHVAIVADPATVLEATPLEGVRVINLLDFLSDADHAADGSPLVMVGRLTDTLGVCASVKQALTYLGRPYDFLYMPSDSAIYCSELVQLSYKRPDGTPVFDQQPMSFSDSTGMIDPYWEQLYAKHRMKVPEGCPGTNPGALSQDTALRIISIQF